MTSAKISKVTISNSNYIGLIVISVELVSCPGFSWTLVTPLFSGNVNLQPSDISTTVQAYNCYIAIVISKNSKHKSKGHGNGLSTSAASDQRNCPIMLYMARR